jgi:hypothetical protein
MIYNKRIFLTCFEKYKDNIPFKEFSEYFSDSEIGYYGKKSSLEKRILWMFYLTVKLKKYKYKNINTKKSDLKERNRIEMRFFFNGLM